jgi:DNA invertase Pin-like site-specific DNA recombinase
MSVIFYNRVSTPGQNVYGKNVSLAMQESICNKFAHDNNLRVTQIMKEIRSASRTSSPLLKQLIDNSRNKNILFMDVSRFSRNINQGLALASQAIINSIKLIFIHEKFTCITDADLPKMKALLSKTEEESKVIGIRIKTARNHLRAQGMYAGGTIPFGYKLKVSDIGNRLVLNEDEQEIVSFIRICQSDNIQSSKLNDHMKKMVSSDMLKEYVNIDCYDNQGNMVQMIDKMDNSSIALLLNDYDITKRGKNWNSSTVKTAMNGEKYIPYNPSINEYTNTFDDDIIPNVNTIDFQSIAAELDSIVNESDQKHKPTIVQSRRIHNNIDSYDSGSPNPIHHNIHHKSSDIDDAMSDVELFSEFKEFKEFKKFKKSN